MLFPLLGVLNLWWIRIQLRLLLGGSGILCDRISMSFRLSWVVTGLDRLVIGSAMYFLNGRKLGHRWLGCLEHLSRRGSFTDTTANGPLLRRKRIGKRQIQRSDQRNTARGPAQAATP